jgi:hypothetical protein
MKVNDQLHAPGALPPREKYPVTHFTGGWENTRIGLDIMVKRKISCPSQESNPGLPVRSYTE